MLSTKPSRLALFILTSLTSSYAQSETPPLPANSTSSAGSDDGYHFDPSFLTVDGKSTIDLSRFERKGAILPGSYLVDIYVNSEKVGRETVEFQEQPDKSVQTCLNAATFKRINLRYDQLPADLLTAIKADNGCVKINQALPQIGVAYDSGEQRLDLSIPQALLNNTARGYVSPELWDSGVPAAMLGYSLNGFTMRTQGETTNSASGAINAGVNIGGWYFRHNGFYTWQEDGDKGYDSTNTYVQRDIPVIKGRIILGETNTQGQLFDTVPFRGAQLVDDDRMLPESQRGYAPDIRGIARTNARVTVRQNGRVIYETTVSPGAFSINDLYPTGYGGNLDVTVTEADGSTQNFQVPYASVTQLLRPGSHHYSVTAGQLNDSSISSHPAFYQGTYQRGLTNIITGYGGFQASNDYYAIQIGSALSTPAGAISFDVTQSRTHVSSLEEGGMSGQSYQVGYSKFIPDTDSNLTIAAYRFSTDGYMDFMTAMRMRDADAAGRDIDSIWRAKNKLTVTANQGLPGNWGQFYVTGYEQNYWNQDETDLQFQAGYSNNYGNISYSVSAGRVRNDDGDMETSFLFNLSMPLGRSDSGNVPQLNASVNRDGNGNVGEQLGISGTAGSDNQYSYGISAANYNNGVGSSGNANGEYRSPYTNVTASYGLGEGYQNGSVGLSGTIIGYQDGVVLTPYTSDTFAIVEADGASGAKVGSYAGVKLDHWGHAAVPYLNPYEMNEITLDPKGIPYNVELENTSQKVAPNYGAVVRLKYATQHGYPILIAATMPDGSSVPFGASVSDHLGNTVGAVGQMGQVYARVTDERDTLRVSWGKSSNQQCQLTYVLMPQSDKGQSAELTRFASVCTPQSASTPQPLDLASK
ncbi:fimbria/pilus outer membrane usher protein [Edaphovirga cremea]|uniref:fimbria/pilus outer membrane usher protein n=1 Tax=Edaphovirga cremea TaxID=2267246 RepID=UPI003988DCE2